MAVEAPVTGAPVAESAAAEAIGGADPWVAEAEPEGADAEPAAASAAPGDEAALEALRAELAAEKAQVAALSDRIRTLKGRESRNEAALQARIDQLTKQLDVQGLELHRLRKSMIQLREALRVLREGSDGACVDAAMINKAMLAELEGLRAARSSETVELEEIIAELAALTGEEKADA
ncbi:MAG: hypothetical protein JNN06_15320 [Gemmobacter sp.]|nr:hypothetical protein [Gemmobacter sp.]